MPVRQLPRPSSTASPPARWSSGRRAWSRNWSRTRSMPARARIDVLTDGGGRRLIRVTDDGAGMTRADLALAVERHATSKLDGDDLLAIRTLGFRGEALPSIGAVARLTIATRHADEPHAWAITVDAGAKSERSSRPRSAQGTTRRGARPVLRHAGAAEVPQDRPQRGRSRARGGAAAGHEPAGRRLHARRRGARAGDLAAALPARRPARAARRRARRRVPRQCVAVAAEREGVRVEGFAGAADAVARQCARRSICSSTAARCATSC